ncbi:MAG TPA: hypothetical protein VF615_02890 [Longimicrobiaceae bacterium]|jgi:hypothetical protein
MKLRRVSRLLLALPVALLIGCQDSTHPTTPVEPPAPGAAWRSARPEAPRPPRLETATPRYPAVAQYIVYREFVNRHPDAAKLIRQGEPYWQYVEKRLMELYPGTGYRGMVRDAHEDVRRYRAAWAGYQARLQDIGAMVIEPCTSTDGGSCPYANPYGYEDDPSWEGQTEPEPDPYATPTLEEEVQTLRMTQPETSEMYYYESLAWQTVHGYQPLAAASTDDLIREAGAGRRPDGEMTVQSPWLLAGAAASLGYIGYVYWRARVTQERAENRSTALFPGLGRDNTQRDAHRHIFGSVMLRAYVGEAVAHAITDYHESTNANLPVGHVMDYHNNDLGRSVKYKHFRGNFFTDFLQWENWSGRVYRYVTDPRNGEYIPGWEANPAATTWSDAWNREASVPRWKYIYFSNQPA